MSEIWKPLQCGEWFSFQYLHLIIFILIFFIFSVGYTEDRKISNPDGSFTIKIRKDIVGLGKFVGFFFFSAQVILLLFDKEHLF